MSARLRTAILWIPMVAAIVLPCLALHHATVPHAPLAAAIIVVVTMRRAMSSEKRLTQNCGSEGA